MSLRRRWVKDLETKLSDQFLGRRVNDFVTTILDLVVKSVTMMGGCVKKCPKLRDVIEKRLLNL
jgi:hypothetical protein